MTMGALIKRVKPRQEASNNPSLDGRLVLGSSQLFKGDQLQFIPMPTPDPKDPLNLPEWRKWTAIVSLCFFSSLALSIESVIGHLIPIFFLEYNGIDPKMVSVFDSQANNSQGTCIDTNSNALEGLSKLENGTPLSQVVLLSTMPIVVNGVASFLLVPFSTAVGRRPVMLLAGLLAWIGGIWAGLSAGLESHLAARCFQGFGAGVVDALIPLILQDLMFIHQRNKAIATLNASQGVILICLGIASPYIALRLSWRYLYLIFSCLTALSWISIILCVPETRVDRSKDELAGRHIYNLYPGEARPRLDHRVYGPRTKWTDLGVLNTPLLWKQGRCSLLDTIKCFLFPTVLWGILLTSIMAGAGGAAGQTAATVLLAAGWKFENLGLTGLSVIVATPFVWLFSGYLADRISNHVAKRRGGHREPEDLLVNLVLPIISSTLGACIFGYAAANTDHLPSILVLVGVFFFVFGAICTSTTIQVFLVESYPNFAGPVLVTFSSLRLIIGFGLIVKATDWIKALGFTNVFCIYGGLIAFVALLGILVWMYGKNIRVWTAGTVQSDPEPGREGGTETIPDSLPSAEPPISRANRSDFEKRRGAAISCAATIV